MELYDLLRHKTNDIRSALNQLNNERVPSLGQKIKALEKQYGDIETEIADKTEHVKNLKSRLDAIAQRLRQLEEEKDRLQAERPQILDELNVIEEELKRRRSDKERLAEQIAELKASLHEAVEERNILNKELRQRELEALQTYLSETRSRLNELAMISKDLAQKRAMRKRLEEQRHRDPNIMSLWERRVELRKLLRETRIEANRQALECLLQEVEKEIEERFPGALEVESSGLDSVPQETLYAIQYPETETLAVLLPISREDFDLLRNNHTDPLLVLLLRLGWALARQAATAPLDCLIKLGSHDWVIAIFKKPESDIIGKVFPVPLSGGETLTLRVKLLPHELQDLVCHEA